MEKSISNRAHDIFESKVLDGQKSKVEEIKEAAAVLWDHFDNISVPTGNIEATQLVSLAKIELESAVVWAIKAISRNQ